MHIQSLARRTVMCKNMKRADDDNVLHASFKLLVLLMFLVALNFSAGVLGRIDTTISLTISLGVLVGTGNKDSPRRAEED